MLAEQSIVPGLILFGIMVLLILVVIGVSLFQRYHQPTRKRSLERDLARLKQEVIHTQEDITAIQAAEIEAKQESTQLVKP